MLTNKILSAGLAAVGVAAPLFALAIDDSNYIEMYRDYPIGTWRIECSTGGSWENRSDVVYANEHAIRANVPNNEYFQVRDSWGGLTKTGSQFIEFYFYSETELLSNMEIEAASSNNTGPRTRLSLYATQNVGAWTQVRVPWAALGLTVNSKFRLFRLYNVSGAPIQFRIDEIRVVRPVVANAAVVVDSTNIKTSVAGPMFGAAGGIFDPYFDYASTKVRIAEGGINTFTYPGGTIANNFDWRTNMDIRYNQPAVCTVDGYLKMADQMGANKIINVNYGSGTPEDARDWLYYTNVVRQSNVKYWGIGNENYGIWSYDLHPFPHDALSYAEFAVQAITLMKAVDPTIKVGVGLIPSETTYPQRVSVTNPVTGQQTSGWTPVVLSTMRDMGVLPDYVELHYYPQGPFAESDNNVLMTVEQWEVVFEPMRRILRDYLGTTPGNNVDLFITENNGSYFNPGRQSVSIVTALYLAKSWMKVVELGGKSFVWWRLHQSVQTGGNMSELIYGWREYGDYGVLARGYPQAISPPVNEPYPAFYAFKMLKLFARPGSQILSTTSDNLQVAAMASRDPQSGRIKLMLLNTSRENTITTSISTIGFQRTAAPAVFTYGINEDVSLSDIKVWQVPNSRSTRRFEVALPPYSINVIEL